jgi:hypothetical protein
MAESGVRGTSEEAPAPPPSVPEDETRVFRVGRREFKRWFDAPSRNFVMGSLPPRIRELLGAKSDALIFSQEMLAKQKGSHPDISVKVYVGALNKIRDCTEAYPDGPNHIRAIVKVGGKSYRLALKATRDRTEVYLASLYRQREKDLRRVRRKK